RAKISKSDYQLTSYIYILALQPLWCTSTVGTCTIPHNEIFSPSPLSPLPSFQNLSPRENPFQNSQPPLPRKPYALRLTPAGLGALADWRRAMIRSVLIRNP